MRLYVALRKGWSESARLAALEARQAKKAKVERKETKHEKDRAIRVRMNYQTLKRMTTFVKQKQAAYRRAQGTQAKRDLFRDLQAAKSERNEVVAALRRDRANIRDFTSGAVGGHI